MYIVDLISDVDYCVGAQCQYGGTCVDGLFNYTCSCPLSHTGNHCETGNLFHHFYSLVYYPTILLNFCQDKEKWDNIGALKRCSLHTY